MHFDDRTVETYRFDPDPYELLMLQLLEQPIQHTGFCPAVHAGVDSVPIAEALGRPRRLQPFSAKYRIALTTYRLVSETLPRCTGNNVSIRLNCSEVISMSH